VRIGLLAGAAAVAVLLTVSLPRLMIRDDSSGSILAITNIGCRSLEPLLVEAQSVPASSDVPCVRSLPIGWTFGLARAGNGRSVIELNHDRAGPGALTLIFTRHCAVENARPSSRLNGPVARLQAPPVVNRAGFSSTWHDVFDGGCATVTLHAPSMRIATASGLPQQSRLIVGYVSRDRLRQALANRSDGQFRLG
jgi:hypothetical protein